MRTIRSLAAIAVAGVVSLGAALGATAASAATAATRHRASSVNLTSRCSKGSLATLSVQREDTGQLSIDAGVDMARHIPRVPWSIRVTDNGTSLAAGSVRTIGDGSFSITRMITPRSGTNHVVFYARNLRTGEVCALNGTA